MARKRHTAEEIVAKLRQVDVLMAQGRFPHTSVLTMVLSSSLSLFENGLLRSEPRPLTSSQEVRGRTDIAKASTESCAMNCSTVKSFTH